MNWTTSAATALHKIIVIILLFWGSWTSAQPLPLSPKANISILTCATGNESYSLFGHTAIRISDPEQFIDVVYNYGAFDFSTPNFVAKFAKGDLKYFVVADSYSDFINRYQYEGRSVYEQKLQISTPVKQRIFENLNTTLQSEQRFYTYKFIDRNCTTMVVDVVNEALGKNIITKTNQSEATYRSVLYPYFDHHFYEQLGTSIIFGTKVDQKASTVFLPFELLESLKKSRYQNQSLAAPAVKIVDIAPTAAVSWWNNWYTYIGFLLVVALWKKRGIMLSFLTLMGILGVFFLFMSLYSLHPELANNYNVLLFNPTLLLLVFFSLRKNKKATQYLGYFNWVCFALYTLVIINKAPFLIITPLLAITSLLVYRIQVRTH
ncbi:Lnb N-terminal periplasmic domain-containing protein [Flavobacterium sp. TSSA_36]|uniref:Lnb N-terminal periplasmic domain-containing protein n=1 Tax=Flavobacterium sp. TSSA_36 TaxID=3447669 RepID=UPI003F2CF4F3